MEYYQAVTAFAEATRCTAAIRSVGVAKSLAVIRFVEVGGHSDVMVFVGVGWFWTAMGNASLRARTRLSAVTENAVRILELSSAVMESVGAEKSWEDATTNAEAQQFMVAMVCVGAEKFGAATT